LDFCTMATNGNSFHVFSVKVTCNLTSKKEANGVHNFA
jgi:hypothetical protein